MAPVPLPEVVDDRRVVEAQLAAVSVQDRIWLLQALGRLEQAVGEWLLPSDTAPRRALLLAARVHRCGGVNRAGQLQTETHALAGTPPLLSTIRDHIGGRLCDQHRYTAASAEFEAALAIRTRAGTDPGPTASSAMAARRACALAGRP